MINKNSKSIKMLINGKNYIYSAGSKNEQTDWKLYQKKMGLIMYIVINIRLDIIFVVGKLSQYMVNLTRYYKQVMKYLMWYL